ncbi:hypothetical protein AAG570_008706 [Ranatra chinensis]|uniref:MRG domain-containing protein n=1 Tax=Ranatra chinensis TaxID=642074 RepID=A0ABD0ZEZ5_9HEMI
MGKNAAVNWNNYFQEVCVWEVLPELRVETERERKKRTHKLTDRGEGGEAKRPPPPPPPPTLSSSHSDSDTSDHEEAFPLAVSNTLKSVLELDFQLITRHNKVLNLPAEPNAVSILEMFLKEYATSQMRLACNRKSHLRTSLPSNSHSMTLEGFCRGIKEEDDSCPKNSMTTTSIKEENNIDPDEVKLPELLQHSNHSESKTNLLIDYLCNFMKYLEDHPEWFGEEHYRDNIYPIPPANESTSSKIIE